MFTRSGEIEVNVGVPKKLRFVKPQKLLENTQSLELQFSVRDSGIGIPPSQRKRIFESFTQAHASTTRDFGGTGLGLAICSSLTNILGGEIWLESEVGKGSTSTAQTVIEALNVAFNLDSRIFAWIVRREQRRFLDGFSVAPANLRTRNSPRLPERRWKDRSRFPA